MSCENGFGFWKFFNYFSIAPLLVNREKILEKASTLECCKKNFVFLKNETIDN